jgi:hypothetical protein
MGSCNQRIRPSKFTNDRSRDRSRVFEMFLPHRPPRIRPAMPRLPDARVVQLGRIPVPPLHGADRTGNVAVPRIRDALQEAGDLLEKRISVPHRQRPGGGEDVRNLAVGQPERRHGGEPTRRGPRGSAESDSRQRRLGRVLINFATSASLPKADMGADIILRRFVPKSCREQVQQHSVQKETYSITSSARASSVGGISRPNALAVWRLMTNANLVDCCTGRSAGFAPLRI